MMNLHLEDIPIRVGSLDALGALAQPVRAADS